MQLKCLRWFVFFKLLFLVNMLCVPSISSLGQTPNNNMVNAERLKLNQFVNSLTNGNTVEANCVDEKLTGKCIDYHNDQWFTFDSDSLSQVYINISDQKCRDLRGVQLVLFEGELCRPETYDIIDCVSLATQDDIYIAFDQIKPHTTYWLNIDGYLHDFCEFFIEVSDTPKGFSSKVYDFVNTKIEHSLNQVEMKWKLPDSLSHTVKATVISRRVKSHFRFDSIGNVAVNLNAYGNMQTDYQYFDTLFLPDTYFYRMSLVMYSGENLLFKEFSHEVTSAPLTSNQIVKLALDYRNNTPLKINIFDVASNELLDQLRFNFTPKQHSLFTFYTTKYIAKGIAAIEVQVINTYDRHEKSYFYQLSN